MRIFDLAGWPPSRFQTAEAPPRLYSPRKPLALVVVSATFIQGYRRGGDLLLLLECRDTGSCCSSRLKIQDPDVGRRAERALSLCRGLSLQQAGNREIPEEDRQRV